MATVNRNFKQTEQGDIMLGSILALGLFALIVLGFYRLQAWQQKKTEAHQLGNQIAQIVNAVQHRMSFDTAMPTGNFVDLKFLQNNSCGGTAPEAYLPCGFNVSKALMKDNIAIQITQTNAEIRQAKITVGAIGAYDNGVFIPKSHLAGAVSLAAQAASKLTGNRYLSASAAYALNQNTAVITIDIVANQNNGNIYLKRDGSNTMAGQFVFDNGVAAANRAIKNVKSIESADGLTVKSGNAQVALAANTATVSGNAVNATAGNAKVALGGNEVAVSGNAIRLNPNGGQIFLGNQSGVKGNSNVAVNDLTIASMGNQKLTALLGQSPVLLSGFSKQANNLNFSIKTGPSGSALIRAYGGRNAGYGLFGYCTLYLKHNGATLRYVQLSMMEIDHNQRVSSVAPSFEYAVTGLAPNTVYNGYNVQMAGPGLFNYVGYTVWPY